MGAGGKKMNAYMLALRIKKVALIVAASALSLLGIISALYFDLIPGVHVTISRIDRSYLVETFVSGNNTVDIYQDGEKVCVDAHSTSQADIPHQTCASTSKKIDASNISIEWFVLNGRLEKVDANYPNTTSAHIVIRDGEKSIIDYTESFIENLVDTFNEGIKMQPLPTK